jgi:hypothetical protein
MKSIGSKILSLGSKTSEPELEPKPHSKTKSLSLTLKPEPEPDLNVSLSLSILNKEEVSLNLTLHKEFILKLSFVYRRFGITLSYLIFNAFLWKHQLLIWKLLLMTLVHTIYHN